MNYGFIWENRNESPIWIEMRFGVTSHGKIEVASCKFWAVGYQSPTMYGICNNVPTHTHIYIYTIIYPKNDPNMGKYSMHGAYGTIVSTQFVWLSFFIDDFWRFLASVSLHAKFALGKSDIPFWGSSLNPSNGLSFNTISSFHHKWHRFIYVESIWVCLKIVYT